jgi:hypothetical protein
VPAYEGTRIRITSEESLITALEEMLRDENLPVLSSGVVERPGRLALDFDTVSSVVTLASTLFFSGPIIPSLLKLLRKHKKTRIIVDGPEKRIEIEWHSAITEDEIRKVLEQVAAL